MDNPDNKTGSMTNVRNKTTSNDNFSKPDQVIIRERIARIGKLLATAATEIGDTFKRSIAAHKAPLAASAEAQYRAVAASTCTPHQMIDVAVSIAGSLNAYAGKIDPEIERGMRSTIDAMLLAIAAIPPTSQLELVVKVQLLGQLGPAMAEHVNLWAMVMAALEQDTIMVTKMQRGFSVERFGSVH